MVDGGPSGSQIPHWISSWATVIAPASVLSTLLFYFGYVSSRSQYEYFGIDVDTIGLSTQDYVMRSPQPLLVPLLVLTLLGAGLLTLHTAIRKRIVAAVTSAADDDRTSDHDAQPTKRVERIQRTARVAAAVGLAVLGTGVVLLFAYALVRDWAAYNLVTPLLFATGAGIVAYASRVSDLLRGPRRDLLREPRRQPAPAAMEDTEPVPAAPTIVDSSVLLRRTVSTLIYIVIAASIFWATATVAQWSGRGQAQDEARRLHRLPRVILDTKERLFLRSPGIEESVLPASEGQTFHYRYRRLRLLIVGHDRMFLVPDTWSASNSTLIVPLDGSVRVQFQFQNQAP
ncbi:MAG TPA: hypothetical protein VGP31_14865 [Planosporangium sp.]|jgi:hypothetical protein|nr:hypothetical protein [Planosporangium sp.]